LLGGVAVQAVRAPGLFARLDDYRGELIAELIGMYLEPAMLGLFKRECKRGKCSGRRAEPNETTLADGNIRLEYCRRDAFGLYCSRRRTRR